MRFHYIILVLILNPILLCITSQFNGISDYNANNKLNEDWPTTSQSYIDHPPILITSDGVFSGYSFTGNGTSDKPYIIEGYNITAVGSLTFGIEIRNTYSHFIIRDCIIYTEFMGIGLSYIQAGTSKISHNILISTTNDGSGIALRHMNNSTVERNTCNGFIQGIHIDDVYGCRIHSNIIINSEYQGINIRYSDSNIITNNIITNTNQHGIAIVGTSINNTIHHNRLENNAWADSYDIDGGPSQGPPNSQAYDEGSNNIWYDEESQEGNFWSDYFGIGPYSIDGPTGAVDLYPFHTTGLTPFIIIITIIPSIVAISVLLILVLRKRRKNN